MTAVIHGIVFTPGKKKVRSLIAGNVKRIKINSAAKLLSLILYKELSWVVPREKFRGSWLCVRLLIIKALRRVKQLLIIGIINCIYYNSFTPQMLNKLQGGGQEKERNNSPTSEVQPSWGLEFGSHHSKQLWRKKKSEPGISRQTLTF